jgi:hypothetical protein
MKVQKLKIFLKPWFAEGKSRKLRNNPIPNCKLATLLH